MTGTDSALMTLVRAIVAHDRSTASELIAKTPTLATAHEAKGATRQEPKEHYLNEINHYLYGGDTALHIAAAAYEPAIVRLLVNAGAEVGAMNRRGAQPLHYAADGSPGSNHWNPKAQAETVASLIEAGSDPNATDKSGVAPLHRAVRTRCAAAVRALLEGGADPGLTNGKGSTPLELARMTTGRGGSGSEDAKAQQEVIIQLLSPR